MSADHHSSIARVAQNHVDIFVRHANSTANRASFTARLISDNSPVSPPASPPPPIVVVGGDSEVSRDGVSDEHPSSRSTIDNCNRKKDG